MMKKHFINGRKSLYYQKAGKRTVSIMKRIGLNLVLIWVVFGCRPVFEDKVQTGSVPLSVQSGQKYVVCSYQHKSKIPDATILLLSSSSPEQEQWHDTAVRMAAQNYLILSIAIPSGADTSHLNQQAGAVVQAVSAYLALNYPALKWGAVGTARSAAAILSAGAKDTTMSAAALLTPEKEIDRIDSLSLRAWRERPLLLLAATRGSRWDSLQARRFYARIAEPKKLVWLETGVDGAALLHTDMEPIIRRTIVLLFDRHLRGKR